MPVTGSGFQKRFGGQLQAKHPVGSKRLVSGKVERFGLTLQIAHPDYMVPPDRAAEIERVRTEARARHGWIMDTYLLRKT